MHASKITADSAVNAISGVAISGAASAVNAIQIVSTAGTVCVESVCLEMTLSLCHIRVVVHMVDLRMVDVCHQTLVLLYLSG